MGDVLELNPPNTVEALRSLPTKHLLRIFPLRDQARMPCLGGCCGQGLTHGIGTK